MDKKKIFLLWDLWVGKGARPDRVAHESIVHHWELIPCKWDEGILRGGWDRVGGLE